MKIEKRSYDKLAKTANLLLIMAIIIYSITTVIYFGLIFLQDIFLVNKYNPSDFIFPVMDVAMFIIRFGIVLLFALLILNKDVNSNRRIGLELVSLISVIFVNTIVIRILYRISDFIISNNGSTYVSNYFALVNSLSLTSLITPYALLLFYIGVTIKMVLCKLNPIEIDNE